MIVALTPYRNEDWIAGLTLRAELQWADAVVAYDHASTDQTPSILKEVSAEHPGRVHIVRNDNPSWDEMQHRQAMLEAARSVGATHIAIIDADELLTGNLLNSIRGVIEGTPSNQILQLPLYNLRGRVQRFHATGIWGNRAVSVAFPDRPEIIWQGGCFHHREPFGSGSLYCPILQGSGGILHFWGVDERRLIAKHALYKITERLRWPEKFLDHINSYYNQAIYEDASLAEHGGWTFAEIPNDWLQPYESLMQKYYHSAIEPWQVAEVIRLLKTEGEAKFAGLDLFGALEWGKVPDKHPEFSSRKL